MEFSHLPRASVQLDNKSTAFFARCHIYSSELLVDRGFLKNWPTWKLIPGEPVVRHEFRYGMIRVQLASPKVSDDWKDGREETNQSLKNKFPSDWNDAIVKLFLHNMISILSLKADRPIEVEDVSESELASCYIKCWPVALGKEFSTQNDVVFYTFWCNDATAAIWMNGWLLRFCPSNKSRWPQPCRHTLAMEFFSSIPCWQHIIWRSVGFQGDWMIVEFAWWHHVGSRESGPGTNLFFIVDLVLCNVHHWWLATKRNVRNSSAVPAQKQIFVTPRNAQRLFR